MQAMPVVVMTPALEHVLAFSRMVVRDSIGPFAERGLDEAFGFAVGLRPVGAGEAVRELQLCTGLFECFGAEGRAVIS